MIAGGAHVFTPGEAHVVRILPMITEAARTPLLRRPRRKPMPASRQAVKRKNRGTAGSGWRLTRRWAGYQSRRWAF